MVKVLVRLGIIALIFITFSNISFAFVNFGGPIFDVIKYKPFGGRIIHTKATEIRLLETDGYECTVPGMTIQIKSVLGPTDYFIPSGIKSKSRNTPADGQAILGKYGVPYTIECVLPGDPPEIRTVTLPTIILFGTSKSTSLSI